MESSSTINVPIDRFYKYLNYSPSPPLAYTSMFVFLSVSIYLIVRIYKQRAPVFMFRLIILSIIETIGFILRAVYCTTNDINLTKFLAMNICLLLVPNILATVNYDAMAHIMTLSRINTDKIYLKPIPLTIFFGITTTIPSILQVVGGSMTAIDELKYRGVILAITGLAIQLCILLLFTTLIFYIKSKTYMYYYLEGIDNPKRRVLNRMLMASVFMKIRVIVRIIQFIIVALKVFTFGEWVLYVFDILIVFICFLILSSINTFFPRRGESGDDTKENDIYTDEEFSTSDITYAVVSKNTQDVPLKEIEDIKIEKLGYMP